jgi:hypothetical protein
MPAAFTGHGSTMLELKRRTRARAVPVVADDPGGGAGDLPAGVPPDGTNL